jgi:hypothetical protein
MKMILQLGTWNVRTILQGVKLQCAGVSSSILVQLFQVDRDFSILDYVHMSFCKKE